MTKSSPQPYARVPTTETPREGAHKADFNPSAPPPPGYNPQIQNANTNQANYYGATQQQMPGQMPQQQMPQQMPQNVMPQQMPQQQGVPYYGAVGQQQQTSPQYGNFPPQQGGYYPNNGAAQPQNYYNSGAPAGPPAQQRMDARMHPNPLGSGPLRIEQRTDNLKLLGLAGKQSFEILGGAPELGELFLGETGSTAERLLLGDQRDLTLKLVQRGEDTRAAPAIYSLRRPFNVYSLSFEFYRTWGAF